MGAVDIDEMLVFLGVMIGGQLADGLSKMEGQQRICLKPQTAKEKNEKCRILSAHHDGATFKP